jgi:putative ABC transport system permease protein
MAPEGSSMQDLRFALRTLCTTPVVTAVAILSLAVGVGANTAIFSLVDSLLLRPLPVAHPQRLAVVLDSRAYIRQQGLTEIWTYGVWEQIRQRAVPAFDGACAYWAERLNIAPHGGEIEPVDGIWVSGEYFATLGVPALLGRVLDQTDDVKDGGHGPAAVISYEFWQRRFGGAANVLGAPITVERVPFTVVGVTPPQFFGAEVGQTFDVALPMNAEPLIRGAESHISGERMGAALAILLRLKPAQTVDTATAILRGIQPQVRDAAMPPTIPPRFRSEFLKEPFSVTPAGTGTSRLRVLYERPLLVVLVLVGLVLLIACVNIANLQTARAIGRAHEVSVRIALGASTWQVARQWFVEALLVSAAGVGLGILFAQWFSRLLVAQLSTVLNRVYLDLSLDWRVLVFTAGIAAATTILFGGLPAFRASGMGPIASLRHQGRDLAPRSRGHLSSGLLIAQVALSLVIITAAGLLVRSFEKLATLPLGLDRDRVLLVNVDLARTHVGINDRVPLVEQLVRRVAAIPGVQDAGASMVAPVAGFGVVDVVHLPGVPLSAQAMIDGKLGPDRTFLNFVTPGWFSTYGIPIRAGRDFDERDALGAPPVIVVNEAFLRKFVTVGQPVGAGVAFERRNAPLSKTIVGVTASAAYLSLRNADAPIVFAPLAQRDFTGPPPTEFTISVRAASGAPMLLARRISDALTAGEPDLIFGFRSMTDQVSALLTQERLVALLSGLFGAVALLLAGLGLYGMTAYSVATRRAEIGIRMALGADSAQVLWLVLSRLCALVGTGIIIGVALSAWAAQFVASLLFGLQPRDLTTLGAAVITLAAAAAVAGWLPARRAARIDPAAVLRES